MRPWNTSASVPRLIALASARTSTSFGPRAGRISLRISPWPGATVQKARAEPLIGCTLFEQAFDQQLFAQREAPRLRPQPMGQIGNFRQRDTRSAGADDQRRDRDLQPVEHALFEQPRHSDGA